MPTMCSQISPAGISRMLRADPSQPRSQPRTSAPPVDGPNTAAAGPVPEEDRGGPVVGIDGSGEGVSADQEHAPMPALTSDEPTTKA